jgi:hypothetical protein
MRTFRSAEEQQEIKEQSMRADESERIHGYGDLKLVNLPKPEASNGKVLVRMTAGGKRMYVVLTSDGIATRGETPVLPVYGDE